MIILYCTTENCGAPVNVESSAMKGDRAKCPLCLKNQRVHYINQYPGPARVDDKEQPLPPMLVGGTKMLRSVL